MADCPPELLDDLTDLLADVRTWAGVIEKTRHVFYLGSEPFFHFHLLAGGRRRADIKGNVNWVELNLPRPLTATRRRAFLRALRGRYEEKRQSKRRGTPSALKHTPQPSGARDGGSGRRARGPFGDREEDRGDG